MNWEDACLTTSQPWDRVTICFTIRGRFGWCSSRVQFRLGAQTHAYKHIDIPQPVSKRGLCSSRREQRSFQPQSAQVDGQLRACTCSFESWFKRARHAAGHDPDWPLRAQDRKLRNYNIVISKAAMAIGRDMPRGSGRSRSPIVKALTCAGDAIDSPREVS